MIGVHVDILVNRQGIDMLTNRPQANQMFPAFQEGEISKGQNHLLNTSLQD